MARRIPPAGPLILAAFCLAAVWVALPPAQDAAPTPDTRPQDLAARLARNRATLADLIPVTGARPLFQGDRRPVAGPEAPLPPPEAVLVLVGIIGNGEDRVALVRQSASAELVRIKPGGQLGPWQILSVENSLITVGKEDGTSFTLRLDG